MGAYLSQPLGIKCNSLEDMRRFLKQCRYVSDQEQFGKYDYWMPPEEFEQRKKGDCDDFALWTWRQFLAMGYDTRFVVGHSGRYGSGHAWVTFTENERTFLVEPLMAWLVPKLARLSTVRYQPGISVSWDGERLRYYEHEKRTYDPTLREIIPLVGEWLPWWIRTRAKCYYAWAWYLTKRAVTAVRMSNAVKRRANSDG